LSTLPKKGFTQHGIVGLETDQHSKKKDATIKIPTNFGLPH